jgi:addiction module RelB/DinJ family antitoxin
MNTVLNFKTEKTLKAEAQKVAKELGLPLGTVLNQLLKEFVREKRVLFTNHPTPSKAVVAELQQMSADVRAGKNLSPSFANAKDAMAWLKS